MTHPTMSYRVLSSTDLKQLGDADQDVATTLEQVRAIQTERAADGDA